MEGDERHRTPPWHIRRTGFPLAWRKLGRAAVSRGGPERPVRVAILDTGVDLNHRSLAPLIGGGANVVSPGAPPQDDNGHGTHVAGILAAATGCDPTLRGAPPAWARSGSIRIFPVKIFDHTGFGRISDIVRAIEWCLAQGVDLINCSFGTDSESTADLEAAIEAAHRQGVLVVAAAGNDGRKGEVDYPGRFSSVVAVAASTRGDRLAPFSSSGPQIDLLAPGAGVISTSPGGGYRRMSGTSMAAPHVTAAAALLRWLEPQLPTASLFQRLSASAEWIPTLPHRVQGAGLLRCDRLLGIRS
jgi:subtilisin